MLYVKCDESKVIFACRAYSELYCPCINSRCRWIDLEGANLKMPFLVAMFFWDGRNPMIKQVTAFGPHFAVVKRLTRAGPRADRLEIVIYETWGIYHWPIARFGALSIYDESTDARAILFSP